MSKVPRLSNRATGGGTSVYEWGVLGDGTFNETLKIQNALDNLQHVYFPPGTYLVDGSLTASLDKQVIEGAGKGSVIKMMASKTYDLTKEHAALTMNAGEQTLQDLQLIGPDTGDDSTFSGSGSDWYNLSALRVNGDYSGVNGVQVDRCEGIGMHVSGIHCNVSLCLVQRTGLDGLNTAAREQFVMQSRFANCQKATYGNITTYPSSTTFGVHLSQKDGIISECFFINNTTDIVCREYHHAISNNILRSGILVETEYAVVSNNVIRADSGNAIKVVNDGSSYISSLTGNDVAPMDQGGADDIIAPASYGQKPVLHATGNRNSDIDRIYQQKAHATIRPNDASNNGDGSVPFKSTDHEQLINVNVSKDRFTVERNMLLQISMPPVVVNTNFDIGEFHVYDEDSGSTVNNVWTSTYDNSVSSNIFVAPAVIRARLQPNTTYKLYMYSDQSQTVADLGYDENWIITMTDLE